MSKENNVDAEDSATEPERSAEEDDVQGLSAPEESEGSTPEHRTKRYSASIYPKHPGVPPHFAEAIQELEKTFDAPVWLLVQNSKGEYGEIGEVVRDGFFAQRHDIETGKRVVLLLDSPGGFAKCAYQIASIFQKQSIDGEFVVIVPRYAKSAATLLSLGANRVVLGEYGELGPLDAQFFDSEREEPASALDEVKALERLNAVAMDVFDQTMFLLLPRTRKKVDTLLPATLNYIATMMRPLMEKIDVIHYTQMSRVLKVAEEYAIRLMCPRYSPHQAQQIARHLVENYPEHGFVIDAQEAAKIGIQTAAPTSEQAKIIDVLIPDLSKLTVIGRIQEEEEVQGDNDE